MKALVPSLAFCGVGGQRLEAEGVRLVARSSEMGVVGFTEVFSKLRLIVGVFFRLRRMLREEKPDLLILIDYPDFNLPLASAWPSPTSTNPRQRGMTIKNKDKKIGRTPS